MTATGTLNVVDVDLSDTVTVTVDSVAVDASSTFGGVNPLDDDALKAMMAVDGRGARCRSDDRLELRLDVHLRVVRRRGVQLPGSGETLVFKYTLKGTDTSVVALFDTQVVVTITGTNDRPDITAGTAADLQEDTGQTGQDDPPIATSGTLAFTDFDLTDTHTVTTQSLTSAVWSGGAIDLTDTLAAATFTASVATDSTNSGSGTLDWSFSLADHFADFLADGETLVLAYDVGITDDSGTGSDTSTTKQVVITITGTNDAPTIELAPIVTEVPIPNPLPLGTDAAAVHEVAPAMSDDGRWVVFFSAEQIPNGNDNSIPTRATSSSTTG